MDRDLSGAVVYRATGYPGARWHVLDSGEVVLERPSGELTESVLTAHTLEASASRTSSTWHLEA